MEKQGPKYKLIRGVEKVYYQDEKLGEEIKPEYYNAVYFATDSQKIFLNGICYGQGKKEKTVAEVRVDIGKPGEYTLVVKYTDDDIFTFNLGTLLLYTSKLPDDEVVPVKIGNIAAGTKVSELKTKTVSEILDDIIFPEIQPEVTSPRATITFEDPGEYSNGKIFEVGYAAPQNFITDFSKGSAKVVGKEAQDRSGELIHDLLTGVMCDGSNTLPAEIKLGKMNYQYQVHYDKGPEILTSKGVPSTVIEPNPLPEGTVKSNTLTLYGTYPYISNGESASAEYQELTLPVIMGSNTKLPLQRWDDKTVGVMFASEASNDQRIKFRFHESKKITKVEFFNTIGGTWTIFNDSNWQVTADPDEKIIQGHRLNYKVFTTTGNLMGAIQLRFTLEDA